MYEYEPQDNNVNEQRENQPENFVSVGFDSQTYKEKKKVRRSANIIGISLIILTVFSGVWAEIYYLIMAKMGIDAKRAQEIITEPATLQFVQILFSIIVFTLPFILMVKMNGIRVSDLVPLGKPKKEKVLPFYFMGLGFCAFANISTSIASSIFESAGISYEVDFGDVPKGFLGFILTLISTAVVPALVEEFACRGIMLGVLRKHGDVFAIVASSILFGLVHGNFEQIPFAFLVGLILAFITVKTNSILIAIAVHFTNNLVSVIFDYTSISLMARNTIYIIYLAICMLVGIISVCLYKQEKLFEFEKAESEVKTSLKAKWFFTSPAIIMFAILSLFEAILYFFV